MLVEGRFSISVPGAVPGWHAMHEPGGSRPFGELLQDQAGAPATFSLSLDVMACYTRKVGRCRKPIHPAPTTCEGRVQGA